jgi:hypothetical protein
MVWIRCKSGEFLDPRKISAIHVHPCTGSSEEVEIFAEYCGASFLLYRTTLAALKRTGVRRDKKKFLAIIEELQKGQEGTGCLTFEEIMGMMLEGDGE